MTPTFSGSRVVHTAIRGLIGAVVIVLIGVIAACRTTPSVAVEEPGVGLPSDLDAFVSIDVRQNRDLLDVFASVYGLDADELAPALNRTERVTIGVSTSSPDGASPAVFIILTGSYPRTALSLSLRRSAEWTRRSDSTHGIRYESVDGVTVAVPDRRTVLASTAQFGRLAEAWSERSPGPPLPAEVVDGASSGFVLYARAPDLTGVGRVAPPVASARIVVASRTEPDDSTIDASGPMRSFAISIALRSEADARALVVVMRLALPFIATDAGFPLAVAMRGFGVTRVGADVVVTTPEIDADRSIRLAETLGRYAGFVAQ